MLGKAIIFSAPSGAGKTTIVRHLLEKFPQLEFSISATTREKRSYEVEGQDYYFLDAQTFKDQIANDKILEWQEVYDGLFYGTLRREVDRIWAEDKIAVFDVDVVGGANLKQKLGDSALAVFISVQSIDTLGARLKARNTESEDSLRARLAKAEYEMTFASKFDRIVYNEDLESALLEAEGLVTELISK